MNLSLVQILVVVANIKVKTFKAEVEKGFMRTALVHELVDPKAQVNPKNGMQCRDLLVTHKGCIDVSKGNQD